MKTDTNSMLKKSFESRRAILKSSAPRILRIPTSLVLRSAVNVAIPNNPRQAMAMASKAMNQGWKPHQ